MNRFFGACSRWTSTARIFLLCVLCFLSDASASPITSVVTMDTPFNWEQTISHSFVIGNDNHTVIEAGANWSSVVPIVATAGIGEASISIMAATLQHMVGPHGEGIGPQLQFNLVASTNTTVTGPLPTGTHTFQTADFKPHNAPTHRDFGVLTLAMDVRRTAGNAEITGYRITLTGSHPLPEPCSAVHTLIGMAAIFRLNARRRT
jgi:hypothetical protein